MRYKSVKIIKRLNIERLITIFTEYYIILSYETEDKFRMYENYNNFGVVTAIVIFHVSRVHVSNIVLNFKL